MLNVAETILQFSVIFWNFDPERVSNFDAEGRAGVSHASEAIVGAVETLRHTVHEAPLLFLEIGGLSVFNLASGVVIPKDLLAFALSSR